jgi:hypothetical protein
MRSFPAKSPFCTPVLVAGVLFCLIPPAWAQSKEAPGQDVHRFQSPDHAVTFQYSYPMRLCREGDKPGCREDTLNLCSGDEDTVTVVACVAYAGKTYERYNFRSAIFFLGRLRNAKDEAACFDLSGAKGSQEKINGISFASSQGSEGAMGTLVEHKYYRAFHGGQCYTADLSIATSNYGAMDPARVKEFKPSDFDEMYGKLRQVLNTLHISGADK